jgi:predicted alpha/beta hydrolase family esterase
MQQVVYIGGGDSFSDHAKFIEHLKTVELRDPRGEGGDKWPKSLREKLGEGYELFQIAMPNTENAKYEEWKIWLERHLDYLGDGVVFIGWSLGGMFLLKYFTEENTPFVTKSLHIVASPAGDYGIEAEPGNDCRSFQFSLHDLGQIMEEVGDVTIYHSEDDFVVPYDHALKLMEVLPEAELLTFTDRNHFLQAEFPELVDKIKAI